MAFPGTYNFDYYRGDTFQFVIVPKTSAGTTFPLDDFAAAGAIFSIATSRGNNATTSIDSVSDASKLSATINTTTDTIACVIKPDARADLIGGATYYYDVEIFNGAALRYTLLTGEITVTDDVTGA
jgi:phosphosulfolactate phosphohydrolase-like enzyme